MPARPALLLAFLAGGFAVHLASSPAPAGAAGPADFTTIVERWDASVVHVTTRLEGERPAASRDDAVGAGFVLRADGLVVTSRHVLRAQQQVLVSVKGRGTFPAQVVGQDEVADVAVLRVPVQGLVPVLAGNPRTLRVGEWVLAAGSPYHLSHSWSVGIVSGLQRSQVGVALRGYEDFIQTDAAANLGNSGGPLFNASGEVVGMVTAILSRTGTSVGVTLAVPIDVVLESARALAEGRLPLRPTMGVVVRELDVHGTGSPGLQITRFETPSPARQAGLQVGDVIVEVAGADTVRVADLQRAVWAQRPGTRVTVRYVRGGRRLEAGVVVELPPR